MRKVEIMLYTYAELSEEAQKKAVNKFINSGYVDNDWWESVYEDAKESSMLKITSFDIDRRQIEGEFIGNASETADLIFENHGETTPTYLLAVQFNKDRDALVEKYSDGVELDKVTYENEQEFDQECDELEKEFLNDILNEYLKMLRNEYEYKNSEQYAKDFFDANETEFTADGKTY